MSTVKQKFLLLKSKQFKSDRVVKECYNKGVNTRYPFTFIPDSIVTIVYKKFKKLFNTIGRSKFVKRRIEHIQKIRTYKGIRHRKGLPVRGQRTHTNAKTRKKSKRSEFIFKGFDSTFNKDFDPKKKIPLNLNVTYEKK